MAANLSFNPDLLEVRVTTTVILDMISKSVRNSVRP